MKDKIINIIEREMKETSNETYADYLKQLKSFLLNKEKDLKNYEKSIKEFKDYVLSRYNYCIGDLCTIHWCEFIINYNEERIKKGEELSKNHVPPEELIKKYKKKKEELENRNYEEENEKELQKLTDLIIYRIKSYYEPQYDITKIEKKKVLLIIENEKYKQLNVSDNKQSIHHRLIYNSKENIYDSFKMGNKNKGYIEYLERLLQFLREEENYVSYEESIRNFEEIYISSLKDIIIEENSIDRYMEDMQEECEEFGEDIESISYMFENDEYREKLSKALAKRNPKEFAQVEKSAQEYTELTISRIGELKYKNELELLREQIKYNPFIKTSNEELNLIFDYIDCTKEEILKEIRKIKKD